MNDFEKITTRVNGEAVRALGIQNLQVNLGPMCNQECTHCHIEASPSRKESMDWSVMKTIVTLLNYSNFKLIDITGGAPEKNLNFKRFIKAVIKEGLPVQVRTNLTALEPFDETIKLLKENRVKIVASMPDICRDNVDSQRGEGVFEKSIRNLRRLNGFGYGIENGLHLDLVYNPSGPYLPPKQSVLKAKYQKELGEKYNIIFNEIIKLTNMPIGRFLKGLQKSGQEQKYRKLLAESFNPQTIGRLMCRNQINVGWDGGLYDCDFNLALGLKTRAPAPNKIENYNHEELKNRKISLGNHCYGCTAGGGSSCGGVLCEV
jgi:radical SAM/Cys-rich protein